MTGTTTTPAAPAAPADEFGDAFAQLTAAGDTPPAAAPAAPAVVPGPDGSEGGVPPAAVTPPAETPHVPGEPAAAPPAAAPSATPPAATGGTEPPAAPATPPAADTPPAAPAAPAVHTPTAEEWQALQREIAELRAARETPPAAPAAAPAPAAPPPPLYSADEETFLQNHFKEWEDVARGESLVRRGEYQRLTTHIFTEIGKVIQPLLEAFPQLQQNLQYRDLKDDVPDYDAARDAVIDWVDTQPAFLKAAYEQVMESGTSADIAAMYERFKKETGWTAPAATAPNANGAPAAAAPPAAPAAAALTKPAPAPSAAAAAAAAALAPVRTSRTDPAASPDPTDFDGAWKEITAQQS